jgi:serine protease inhibitor
VQKGLGIQPAFESTLANNYKAPRTLIDFIANSEAARSEINRWIEEHTTLPSPGAISQVLANLTNSAIA